MSTKTDGPKGKAIWKRVLQVLVIAVLVILGIALVVALVPVSIDGFETEPSPAEGYTESLRRFEALGDGEKAIVNEASSSQLMVHGDQTGQVYVLVHGTTNSPRQWVELGEMLYERGHNVLILRMPYHGLQSHRVSELGRTKAEDLRAYADQAIDLAAGLGEEVDVIGISGGGVVAGWMAQNRPEVERAVLLSPFLGIAHTPFTVDTLLMNLFTRAPNVVLDNPAEPRREWVYRGESTRGVAEFIRFGRAVLKQAKSSSPEARELSVLTTAHDSTADNRAAGRLVKGWVESGTDVSTYQFDTSLEIPHNSIDPAADPEKKAIVYAKILELLGEGLRQ